jgi:undecaprenyl diphosphate synthase
LTPVKFKKLINPSKRPSHVAIIMDGNGRWARKNSLPRAEGHKYGANAIEPLMDSAMELGLKTISLYAFSTENWMRPKSEILSLWKLLEYFFTTKIDVILEKGIRIKHTGFLKKIPSSTKKTIINAVDLTSQNDRITLNFCINYGSQQEIVEAVNNWVPGRKKNEKLCTKKMGKLLNPYDLPNVDLLIRTSGEFRLSNFMLWQIAYAELVFLDVLWPDFKPFHLYKSIYEYQNRERRYGGI